MGAVGGAGFQPRRKGTKELLGFSPWGRKPQRLKPEIAEKADVRVKTLTRKNMDGREWVSRYGSDAGLG